MTCARCHGLMVERPLWQREWQQVSARWPRGLYWWTCVNCGNCVDETIVQNQRAQRALTEPNTVARYARIWRMIRQRVKEVAA